MDKIVFSWTENLHRDVSLFEEVEFAPIRVLLKYIYPSDLVERLPLPCRPICESLTEKMQTLHVNLYSEEAIQELYNKDSVSLKLKKIEKFIEDSLHRLLESKEHGSHPLFTRKMIPALVEFFVNVMKTPPTTVVSPDLTPLRRPAGRIWKQASNALRSEIEVSQSRFLFHYFLSYLRKLVECCENDGVLELRLRPKEDVISSFSQGNVEDLFSPLVTSPKIADFEIDDERCLVSQSAVCLPQKVIKKIIGTRVFFSMDKQSTKSAVLEMATNFIERHRKICTEMAPWLDPAKYGKLRKLPAKSLVEDINSLANKLSAALYLSFPGLYTRFNLEAAHRHFLSKLPLKRGSSKETFLDSIAIEFNPEPLPFIEEFGSHLRPCRRNRVADFQQALFYNTMYFYYHYATHWFRRIAFIERSNGENGPRYSLQWRREKERNELLGKSAFWVTSSESVQEERRKLYAEKYTRNDSGARGSHMAAEELSQRPSTSAAHQEEKSENNSKAAETIEEQKATGGYSTTTENEKKKARKRQKSKDTEESGNEEPKVNETEKDVKRSKKRRKEELHSENEEDLEIIDVIPSEESIPILKRKRKKSCDVVELSSDEESPLLPDDAWELKWKLEADRLFKDDDVPSLVTLTLQTVLENSRCLRFQLRALGVY